MIARATVSSRRTPSGSSQPTGTREEPLAAAPSGPPATTARGSAAGRPGCRAPRRRGRPSCRSSGAPARVARPPRARWRGSSSREALRREQPARRLEDRRGCPAGPGRRPRRPRPARAATVDRAGTTKCSRAKASDSTRSRSRSSRVLHRRVLISSTTWPSKPVPARCRRNASAVPSRPAPGTRCSSLAEPIRRSRSTCRQPVAESGRPSPPRRRARSRRARGRWSSWVVLLRRVVAGQVHRPSHASTSARRRAPGVHVLDGERRSRSTPRVRAMPSTKAGGVLLLPAERRVYDDHAAPTASAISADRWSLPHGSVPQTRWVNSRHGACTRAAPACRGGRPAAGRRRSAGSPRRCRP